MGRMTPSPRWVRRLSYQAAPGSVLHLIAAVGDCCHPEPSTGLPGLGRSQHQLGGDSLDLTMVCPGLPGYLQLPLHTLVCKECGWWGRGPPQRPVWGALPLERLLFRFGTSSQRGKHLLDQGPGLLKGKQRVICIQKEHWQPSGSSALCTLGKACPRCGEDHTLQP